MNELNHIAIIMDGNGRWGLKKKGSRNYGHLQGLKTVQDCNQIINQTKNSIFNALYFFNRKLEQTRE